MNRVRALLAVTPALAALAALAVSAAPAQAGEWIQVSCINPDGSAAPSDGWSSFTTGSPGVLSDNDTHCTPATAMSASLSDRQADAVGTSEDLEYQPPAGSTLAGGTVDVDLVADGTGNYAHGEGILYEPAFQDDGSDVFFECLPASTDCANGGNDYAGDVSLPANAGGNFYVGAACNGLQGGSCNGGGSFSAWALAQVRWARFELSNQSAPVGTGFGGSALQRDARGTAHLVFTASDPGGPGVYSVTASIDGRAVWQGVPNGNAGRCAPVGSDPSSSALMFDWQQPCPVTEVVDIPVPTGGLPDGGHELTVTVTDAAQNSSTVLDQTITTSNPLTTPTPRSARVAHARFVISWRWEGNHTLLRSIKVQKLTRHAEVALRCLGRGCPRLRLHAARAAHVAKLMRDLGGKRFRAGDRLRITVTAAGRAAERIEVQIRDNQLPRARLVRR